MAAPFNMFYGKIWVSLNVNTKNGTRDFQNSPPFERSACFYKTISENFEHFQYFKFETDFETNRMVTRKWAYHRERSFASNYFISMKVLFQFKNFL